MKIRHAFLALIGAVSLALSGCAEDTTDESPVSSSSFTVASSSSTSPTSSSSATVTSSDTTTQMSAVPETTVVITSEPAALPATTVPTPQAAAPTFVECIYGGGSWTSQAMMSDGSYQWSAVCQQKRDEQRAEAPYQCPQTDYFVPDPWYCDNQTVPWSIPPPSPAETPAYLLPDSQEELEGKQWWNDCMSQNNAEYCRSVDPYVNG